MHKNSPKNLFCLWVISSLNCHRIYWWLSNPPHRKRMAFPFPPPPLDFFWSRGISSSSSSRLEVSMPPPNAINITSENPQGRRRGGRRGLSFFCGGAKKVPKEKSLRLGWKGEWRCERVFGISNLNPILLHPSHPTPLVSLTNFAASPPLSSMLFTSSTTCPIFGKALHASSFHERQKTFYDATHTSICLLGSLVEAPCLVAFFDYGSWRQKELVGWAGNWFPSPHPSTLAHLPTFPPGKKKERRGKRISPPDQKFLGFRFLRLLVGEENDAPDAKRRKGRRQRRKKTPKQKKISPIPKKNNSFLWRNKKPSLCWIFGECVIEGVA